MEKDQERCVSFLLDLVDANGRLVSDVPPRVATLTVPAPLMELKEGYKLYATGEKSASAILWSSLQDEFRTAFSSYYDLPDPLVILYNDGPNLILLDDDNQLEFVLRMHNYPLGYGESIHLSVELPYITEEESWLDSSTGSGNSVAKSLGCCSECWGVIDGFGYRCLECEPGMCDLCARCGAAGKHPEHALVRTSGSMDIEDILARRSVTPSGVSSSDLSNQQALKKLTAQQNEPSLNAVQHLYKQLEDVLRFSTEKLEATEDWLQEFIEWNRMPVKGQKVDWDRFDSNKHQQPDVIENWDTENNNQQGEIWWK